MGDRLDVVVVGADQAGLATSHELAGHGVPHVVLERGKVGETWRNRWTSFCLVTPNWSMRLPAQPYDGEDFDAFDPRDDIVGFLERHAARSDAPVHEGVAVSRLEAAGGGFRLDTSAGEIHDDGASTVAPGLYFVGVHFLRTRKSSLFLGVGGDARLVADAIAAA